MSLSYLYTSPQSIVDPPIETSIQELPFEKLQWEDFEKLCLAVVQLEFSINDCEIYGVKGQAQQGIDIFARKPNGRYCSYQCKRYQEFNLKDLIKAIEYFKSKEFYVKSDILYLCTSCELNKSNVQDKFEELKTELQKVNITLVKWDKIQLSRLLKENPQIVFDFFGLEWVKKFNGELSLRELSKSKKFDAMRVVNFRNEMYEFYSTIFNIQDPGIPVKEVNSPYSLQERFIIPDILSNVKDQGFEIVKDNNLSNLNQDQFYYSNYGIGLSENEFRRRNPNINKSEEESSIDIRIKIDEALVYSNKNIIIGDPGVGKSTMLRYLTLDILSSKPQLENVSQKYGKTLPVWLPFAFITKHLSLNDSLSISEILNLWFKGFGKNQLFDIAKEALEDERLFMIIDGVDEWSGISSAHQAITRIETIRELYDCKVLYSSRPYGFRMLKDAFTNLNILSLASFSAEQQRSFIEKWFTKWTSLQNDMSDEEYTRSLTDNFVKELEQAGDLKKLAETPLLLSILIIQKMQDSVLPKSKLEALKEITQYLIKKHPTKRVADAGIVQESTNDIDFKDIFCEIAIFIQKESNDGVILKSDAQKIIETYLIEYAGYDKAKSKARSEELLGVGANNFGIIIEKSNTEISFGHKQFQEFLAAQRLYDSDEDEVKDFIYRYAANPAFHQVIIYLFGLMQIKQVKKYSLYFDQLKNAHHESYQENYLKLISYEVAINLENTPSDIAITSFESIVSDFENETDPTHKEALLRRILSSLKNGRLKDRAKTFLMKYFPNQNKYSDFRIHAMKSLSQLNDLQINYLKMALINGSLQLRYDASYAFKRHIKNEKVFLFIKDLVLKCSNPDILAFAINCLITDDIPENERETLISTIEVGDPVVQLYLLKSKIFSNRHDSYNLELVVSIINQLSFQLRDEVIDVLTSGFGDSNLLKRYLVKSVGKKQSHGEDGVINDKEVAWKVLFHSFSKDEEIINLVKSEFDNEEYPFSFDMNDLFQSLIVNFKGVEELVPSVENWLVNKFQKIKYVGPEIAFACVFARSNKSKEILLNNLYETSIPHWNIMALLTGWESDIEIKEKIKDYFRNGETKNTSAAAHYISKVFNREEKEEAIRILEDILFDKTLFFRERAISSLIEIDKNYFEDYILNKLLNELDQFSKGVLGQYYNAIYIIVDNFNSNKAVQKYVFERLENDVNLYKISVYYYNNLLSNEERLLQISSPLPKELRLLILEAIADLSVLPSEIENVFYDFGIEEDEEVMAEMSVCLFNHLKNKNINKIIDLSKPLVFARGFDHEVKRNIAFTGYVISKKLDEYFEVQDSDDSPRHLGIFDEYSFKRYSGRLMANSIIENFEYFISNTQNDFNKLIDRLKLTNNVEDIWGFFARHSTKSSPTYKYILNFIANSSSTLKNDSIISFLNRTDPRSPILKDILLRIINDSDRHNSVLAGRLLGTNFKNDILVYNEVMKVSNFHDSGRIIALCNGWPSESILKTLFDDIVRTRVPVDNYVAFNLKFLFRDIPNLIDFLKNIATDVGYIKRYHRFFFIPMLERLKRDKDFSLAIKGHLLSSNILNEKISYYNLLSQINGIDEEINLWKMKIVDFKNDYGYDIVSNKTVRLKDVLHDL